MVIIIHNGEEFLISRGFGVALSFILLSHESIKLTLNISSMLINSATSLLEITSQFDRLLGCGGLFDVGRSTVSVSSYC